MGNDKEIIKKLAMRILMIEREATRNSKTKQGDIVNDIKRIIDKEVK